jgi:hypothetical protein
MGVSVLIALTLVPAEPALAHTGPTVVRDDLPVPDWIVAWAAALALLGSFAVLSTAWRKPRFDDTPWRRLARLPGWLDPLAGAIGIALFIGAVYSGFSGSPEPSENILPTVVWVIFAVGIAVLSALVGDIFAGLSPWRAAAKGSRWVVQRCGLSPVVQRCGLSPRSTVAYPTWLGRWPAVLSLATFAWLQLAFIDGADPRVLATLALAYAAVQLAGMALFGIETWTWCGDGLGAHFNLFGRISPVARTRDGVLVLRRPLSGLATLPAQPGALAFLCVMIGATVFDGAGNTPLWHSVSGTIQRFVGALGVRGEEATQLASTVGLLSATLLVAAVYRAGIAGMRIGRGRAPAAVFASSLVPIAFGYLLAHYFTLLVFQGQATLALIPHALTLISDPVGRGATLVGSANATIDWDVMPMSLVWYIQVLALVVGHIAALMVAHDKALRLYGDPSSAVRSQRWMLVVMILFTGVGLWLLSASSR